MKRYMRKALRAGAVATPEIPDEKSSTDKKPGSNEYVPARIEITLGPQTLEFDLSCLEHRFDLTPVLSLEDYNYLHELIREDGRVKTANLMPVDDGIERTYRLVMFEWGGMVDTVPEYNLVVHLLEQNGIEHVSYFYRYRTDGGWDWFAGTFANDADTWEFEINEHRRQFAAATTAALRKQLSLQEANRNG